MEQDTKTKQHTYFNIIIKQCVSIKAIKTLHHLAKKYHYLKKAMSMEEDYNYYSVFIFMDFY